MTVVAFDSQRMTENNINDTADVSSSSSSANDTSSNSTTATATTTTMHTDNPSMNIYSANNVIRSTGNGTVTNGGGIPRITPKDGRGPFISIGSKGKETVDLLTSKDHQIDELQSCHNINEVKVDSDVSDKTVLIFDLTTNGFLLSPAAARQQPNFDETVDENCACVNGEVYRIHLSLPSTLVRRPKFDFEKLLQTVIDDSKRSKLINLIENCSTFLFYDGSSTISSCSTPTFYLIKKFSVFLREKLGKNQVRLYILEKMDKSGVKNLGNNGPSNSTSDDKKAASTKASPPKKLNLSIKILPKTTDKMFIQSIKKDTVHYSPNSLRRFFKFNIPNEIEHNDEILPTWLKPFSDKNSADSILQKLLSNFEFLENLELQRLEKGLTTETRNGNGQSFKNLQDSKSYHKIYSLSNLQREFNKQKKLTSSRQNNGLSSSSNSSQIEPTSDLKVCIPLASSNGTTPTNNKIDNSHLSPYVDTDSSESLLTPMDSYEMSQGIQAFTKNRYSNILPYEHSRVKLQPSPIGGPNGGISYSNTNNNNDSTHQHHSLNQHPHPQLHYNDNDTKNNNTFPSITVKPPRQEASEKISSNNNNRKRRSSSISYFSQKPDVSNGKAQDTNDTNKENFSDYFNANYLKIPQVNSDFNYIATQAPLPATVDDFWKVVSINQVKVIISLNSTDELYMRKWDIYWNNNRSDKKYNIDIVDTFENACNVDGCILRIFKFYKNGDDVDESAKSTVFQLQYTKWLDSCGIVMEDIVSLCRIKNMLLHNPSELLTDLRNGNSKDTEKCGNKAWAKELKSSEDPDPLGPFRKSPVLVHCSAGCGRTGVFITLDFILNVLTEPTNSRNSIDVWNMQQDLIFIAVNELRKQRISMVQNLTQYITCYESLLDYFALERRKERGSVEQSV
ncbi:hypothetical protein ZYGR_0S01640 [Zygosaccharomyces rouxii]|uniref:Tyrosine-protein phosphatase 2 n=1 Tax=Zygosaccharomyces rouxii TaxID=4956 RepID=A0A1Q3A360_ZYGRO|nr:hypothetical protein ZYGR_0S01640 [Zygosaccharomyces rouxii]